MKKIIAGKNDAGQRLDKFMTKLMPKASKGMLYKWIRKKRVKVNGKKQEISYILQEGDTLELYINDEFFSTEKETENKFSFEREYPLTVVYEDENILVADKPSGISVHGEEGCLLDRIQSYLIKSGEFVPGVENTFSPSLCNRIDKNTSGLVIAAKNAMALRGINEKIKNREIRKFYLMRIEGQLSPKVGKIEGYTLKNEKERKMIFSKEPISGGKYCETLYRVLDNEGTVEAELVTGRTHQIRASFGAIGNPLCGDVKYGAKKNGRGDFQQLRAYKIVFDFSSSAGELEYLSGKEIERR